MPHRGSSEVAQRRFWNMLRDTPGIMYIGSWESHDQLARSILTSDTGYYSDLTVFEDGPIVFPPEHKLARQWTLTYYRCLSELQSVDYDGTNEWIFKPFSDDFTLAGTSAWARGADWETANLFYDSSPFAMPTSLHYTASGSTTNNKHVGIAYPWAYPVEYPAQGFGVGGYLYGYLNDRYFGNNEMGGDKPSVGDGPKAVAIGDLSKTHSGFWGAMGLSHGVILSKNSSSVCPEGNPYAAESYAHWTFDLCHRPQMMSMLTFNNQISHLHEETYQSEGWGTDVVAIHENTVEFNNGSQETYRQFSVDVSPAGSTGTLNVYTMKGQMLEYGIDYVHDDCDKSGRSYRLLDTTVTDPTDPCDRIYALIVTYLVVAQSHRSGVRPGRQTDTNVAHNRRDDSDIRGL